jgi:hypothetical protein
LDVSQGRQQLSHCVSLIQVKRPRASFGYRENPDPLIKW